MTHLGNRIDTLLRIVVDKKASDLHLAVGSPPIVRVDGDLQRLKWRTLTEDDFESLISPIAPVSAFTWLAPSSASVVGWP